MGFEWAEMERQPCPAGKPAEVAPNSAWGVGDYRPFVSSPKPGALLCADLGDAWSAAWHS